MADKSGKNNPNYRGGFEAKCAVCSNPVWVRPSKAEQGRWCCSKACTARLLSDNTGGPDHWRYQGGPVERTCEACHERFHQRRAEFNRSPAKYCSRGCQNIGRQRRKFLTCEVCYGDFLVSRGNKLAKFCSRTCKKLSQVKERTAEEIARRRVNARVGSLMWYSLKGRKNGCRWERLVGYTCDDLMRHLESLFLPGMTWENSGREWHIDHIRPRSSFSYSEPSDPEFLECWSMSNLQPLWKIDNLKKGSKYIPPESGGERPS